MLKLILTSTSLCIFLCTINAEENATIAKEIKLHKPFSTTIVDGSHLLTLASNWTHILVNSTDKNAKICEIAVDRKEHPIQKKVKATNLGDKIIIWGVRTKYSVIRRTRMDYTILIVDPKQCTYRPVKTYEEELLRFDVNENLPDVVTHDDNFDVFYSSMRDCTPCRYSVDGKTIALKQGIEAEPLEKSVSSHVKLFESPALENGFFYAHNYDNQSSVIKLYDQNFNVIDQKKFKHRIDAVAVSSGDHPSITTCHAISIKDHPLHNGKVNCERLNANLESVFSTDLPLLKKHDPTAISLAVDEASGDSFITVKESSELEKNNLLRLYRLSSTGQVINTFKLCEEAETDIWSGHLILRGFIFNKQYCFETTKTWSPFGNPSNADKNESIKCIAI